MRAERYQKIINFALWSAKLVLAAHFGEDPASTHPAAHSRWLPSYAKLIPRGSHYAN